MGSKQFITCGDGDFAENIIHLFLARIEGAAPGTRGISLFVVPKYWVNEDGSLEDNDVVTTAIEHKMGLHAQPTAALAFGDNDRCRGWLVGEPPGPDGVSKGMVQMFQMMNEERKGTVCRLFPWPPTRTGTQRTTPGEDTGAFGLRPQAPRVQSSTMLTSNAC